MWNYTLHVIDSSMIDLDSTLCNVKVELNSSHHHNATSAFIREFVAFRPMLPPIIHFELILCMVQACDNSHRCPLQTRMDQARPRAVKEKKKQAILL